MASVVAEWLQEAKVERDRVSDQQWERYFELVRASLDDVKSLDRQKVVETLEAVQDSLPRGMPVAEAFEHHRQVVAKRQAAAKDLELAKQHAKELVELRQRAEKIQQKIDQVTAKLRDELKVVNAGIQFRSEAGGRQISATNTLMETWQEVAPPHLIRREQELRNEMRDLATERRRLEAELSPGISGSSAGRLQVAETQLKNESEERWRASHEREVDRMRLEVQRVRDQLATAVRHGEKLSNELESIRLRKFQP